MTTPTPPPVTEDDRKAAKYETPLGDATLEAMVEVERLGRHYSDTEGAMVMEIRTGRLHTIIKEALRKYGAAARAQGRREGWQPIETAPKGKIILLFAVTDRRDDGSVANWKMATGHTPFDGPVEWTWDGYRLREWDIQPTHWRPLPEPPGALATPEPQEKG